MVQTQDWKNDQRLEHDLKLYVSQNLKRVEILDYMKRDFGDYNRSLRTFPLGVYGCLDTFFVSYFSFSSALQTPSQRLLERII